MLRSLKDLSMPRLRWIFRARYGDLSLLLIYMVIIQYLKEVYVKLSSIGVLSVYPFVQAGLTAIMFGTANGHYDIVKLLVLAGARLKLRDIKVLRNLNNVLNFSL